MPNSNKAKVGRSIFKSIALLFLLGSGIASAQTSIPVEPAGPPPEKPLFEFGLGAGTGISPDYPASSQSHSNTLAVPVFQYRGQIFRAERDEGVRARVLDRAVWAFDISGGGAFAATSDENRAREGMPDLDLMGEIGPRLFMRLQYPSGHVFQVFTALRAAISTDFKSGRYRGLVFSPGFSFERIRIWQDRLRASVKFSSEFTSLEMQSYFYSVEPQFAKPDRREYQAKAGYLGSSASLSFAYEAKDRDLTFFVGSSLNSHGLAANEDSPLFRKEFTFTHFVGFAWFFYHSDTPGAK